MQRLSANKKDSETHLTYAL